jgi:hypothetical protein
MDVELIYIFIITLALSGTLLFLIFSVNFKKKIVFKFFKNEKNRDNNFYVIISIILFLVLLALFNQLNEQSLYHIILVLIFLILFRLGRRYDI